MAEFYTHIASMDSSGGVQSIQFSNIPQTYDHLEVWYTTSTRYVYGNASGSNDDVGWRWSTSSGGTVDMHNEWGWWMNYATGSAYNGVYKHQTGDPAKFVTVPLASTWAGNDNPNGSSYPQPKGSGIFRINDYSNPSTLSTFCVDGASAEASYAVTSSSSGTGARREHGGGYWNYTPSAIFDIQLQASNTAAYNIWNFKGDLYGITGR